MTDSNTTKLSIVLVHGAFADATGWQKVIPPPGERRVQRHRRPKSAQIDIW